MEKAKRKSNWVRGICIGKGSFGTVSQAVNKSNGEVFAVKSVNLSSPCLEVKVEALENEIRILRRLSSPWVVEYCGDDVTVEDGAVAFRNLYVEYLPGGTAADLAKNLVEENGNLQSYIWCVVSALRYVHSVGIVHCDVKGSNVLLGPNSGEAKLVDFGTAVELSAPTTAPRGSPLWMAPEVIRGEYQGPESDMWSLGCTVIEMVTGNPGWEDNGADTLCRIGYSDELPELPTRLSELGRDFVDKCLRRDPKERWSCDQLLRHPFISSSAVPISTARHSPRCVLDSLDSEFCEDNDDEKDQLSSIPELRTQPATDKIGKLVSTTKAIWETHGWVVVRNVISEKAPDVSNAPCCGDDEEGTSLEFSTFGRSEQEIEGTSSEYSDTGGGCGTEGMDGGRRRLGVEADSRCRYELRGWKWVVDDGRKDFTAAVILLLLLNNTSVYSTSLMCKDFIRVL